MSRRARWSRRRRWLAWSAAVVLACAGYIGYGVLTYAPKREPLPADLNGFFDGCGSQPVAFTGAASYSGPGPHPIAIETTNGNAPNDDPGGWRDQPPAWRPAPAAVQLVACVTSVTRVGSDPVNICSFDYLGSQDSEAMYRGREDITVYEARTGQVAGRASVVGQDTVCPSSTMIEVSLNGPGDPNANVQYTEATVQQLRAALARYVN
jgi:hypothetical protein